MSKVFYDNILDLAKVEKAIKKVSSTHDEMVELWGIVDEIVHHKVMECVLTTLPKKYHREFLDMFRTSPHDEKLLQYLKEKAKRDVVILIKETVALLVLELTKDIQIGKHRG
jgi:hypothetical protein